MGKNAEIDANGQPKSHTNFTDIAAGPITLTGGATSDQGPDVDIPDGQAVLLQARIGNPNDAYVSNSDAGAQLAASRKTIAPGQIVTIRVSNLSDLWFFGTATEVIEYLVEQDV